MAIAAGCALELAALTAAFVHLDRVTSRPTADRRWFQLRGLHPRPYARPHMVRPLLVDKPDPERIIVGNYDGALLSIQQGCSDACDRATTVGQDLGACDPGRARARRAARHHLGA